MSQLININHPDPSTNMDIHVANELFSKADKELFAECESCPNSKYLCVPVECLIFQNYGHIEG